MLHYFEYAHLPPHLQEVSKQFHALAHWIVKELPVNYQSNRALEKLLEAKDCAVRAMLPPPKVEVLEVLPVDPEFRVTESPPEGPPDKPRNPLVWADLLSADDCE